MVLPPAPRRLDALSDRLRKALGSAAISRRPAKVLAASPSVEAEIVGEALELVRARAPRRSSRSWSRRRAAAAQEFEAGLLFLGTLGNNAPFIGLFGTVLGIVTAFRELGGEPDGRRGWATSWAASPRRCIATAVGILVALPAVIFYNVFQKKGADIEEQAGRARQRRPRRRCRRHGHAERRGRRHEPRRRRHGREHGGRVVESGGVTMAGTMPAAAAAPRTIAAINVTPLVDVVLVLLVILMVASTYIVAQTLKVQLPQRASRPTAPPRSRPRSRSSRTARCAGTRSPSPRPRCPRR